MSEDLTNRLREDARLHELHDRPWAGACCREAADEIARLRAALAAPAASEPVAWHLINPTGHVVATEKTSVHAWARIGGFKPTLESVLGFHDAGWRVQQAAAPAAPSVPPGWKLVPVEPTDAMIDATHHGQPVDDIWRDMLAAAPTDGGQGHG